MNSNSSFSSINESKVLEKNGVKDGCNVVFITKNPTSDTSRGEYSRFKKSADKYGIDIYPIDVDKISYKMNDDNSLTIDNVGTFGKKNTLFMFRHAVKIKSTDEEKVITQKNVKNFKKLLKSNGFMISNDASVASICKSKIKTFEVLEGNKVSTIDTIEIDRHLHDSKHLDSIDKMTKFLSLHGMQLPVIVKVNDGTQGIGCFKCEDINILVSIVQYLVKTKGKCLMQPFCDIDYDVRVHVFCKTLKPESAEVDDFVVVGSMKREKSSGGKDFRTNFSLGGQISNYDISKEEKQLAKEAAKSIGAVWCGVDICHDKITGRNYVIEVNSSPALKGVSKVSDKVPTDIMMKHVKRTLSKNESDVEQDVEDRELVGYYETVELDGIPITGNFDTGNSATTACKSNYFSIDGDEVTFELMDKRITKKIVKMKSILHGGELSDKRPLVHMDISFNGKIIKDIDVVVRGLTKNEIEREKKTGKKVGGKRVLISTDIIDRLGLIVHPDRKKKFTKTKKPEEI
ncbi:MAG: hypothetical protein NC548_44335 [Lachnospiraceae bacterium]|nr:hypothetical protein [Lachnospiraceae bacterium]